MSDLVPRRTLLRGLALGAVAVACGEAVGDRPAPGPVSASPSSRLPRTTAPGPTGTSTVPSASSSTAAIPEPSPSASATATEEPSPDPTVEPEPQPEPEPEPEEQPAQKATVAVICRDAWGAKPPNDGFVGHRIERLTVHHSAVVLGSNSKAPGRFRQHQQHHQNQGWPDIAYHLGVDRNGNVYDLRPREFRGDTFTSYDPTGHFLVLAEGDFDKEQISPAQLDAVARVLAWGATAFGVDPKTLGGHRDYAGTSCPGASFYATVQDGTLRRAVERYRDAGTDLDVRCDDATFARVAAIEAGRA